MDYSHITPHLLIGTSPAAQDYDLLRQLGVKLIINMRFEQKPAPDPHQPPLPTLWLPVFDSPLLRIPVHVLQRGVQAALPVISDGGKVYVHCAQGIHRGPAMGAAILVAQGMSPDEALALIKERRPSSDPSIWYIKSQVRKFARAWQGRSR